LHEVKNENKRITVGRWKISAAVIQPCYQNISFGMPGRLLLQKSNRSPATRWHDYMFVTYPSGLVVPLYGTSRLSRVAEQWCFKTARDCCPHDPGKDSGFDEE